MCFNNDSAFNQVGSRDGDAVCQGEQVSVFFVMPMVPPSVNHYVKHTRTGRRYVTGEATAFKQALADFNRGEFVQGRAFSVQIDVTLGKGDRGDVDNFPKLCLDGLADAGAFRDFKGKPLSDAYVTKLCVNVDRKTRPEEGQTIIGVSSC
jgi:Holliday junction resolvase RusA-like endonuclease